VNKKMLVSILIVPAMLHYYFYEKLRMDDNYNVKGAMGCGAPLRRL